MAAKKEPIQEVIPVTSWRDMIDALDKSTSAQVMALMRVEQAEKNRTLFLLRMYGRYERLLREENIEKISSGQPL